MQTPTIPTTTRPATRPATRPLAKRHVVSVSLDRDLHNAIRRAAKAEGMSLNRFIMKSIHEAHRSLIC